jgi:hypothetical protein
MGDLGRSRRRRWRGPAQGGPLQRGARWCLHSPEIEAKTREIASWCRPEVDKPSQWQIHKQARALRSIGAKRIRREGKEWIWSLPALAKR